MMRTVYKRRKKTTVQLTSLLDLLFVMIFVSLMNQKKADMPEVKKDPVPEPVPVVKVTPKPVPTVAKKVIKEPVKEKSSYSVSAIFKFYATAKNPQLPSGSYRMHGSFQSKDGRLELGGLRWIDRPADYDMVPLSGNINDQRNLFRGRIEFHGCKEFTLVREESSNGTPISGKWMGSYTCGQGETGLTLTIQ